MIVLDTNVVSEPISSNGSPAVQAWLDAQAADTLYLTATSLAELLVGIEVLPKGRRKSGLDAALAELLSRLFGPRILPFDGVAATKYATLIGRARNRRASDLGCRWPDRCDCGGTRFYGGDAGRQSVRRGWCTDYRPVELR
jgi:predicted nucleic acid-binding protein